MKLSHIAVILLCTAASYANDTLTMQELYQKANAAYAAQSYEQAYPLLEALNDQAPENPEINFLLGRCALELKRYDEAIAAFDRVLIINPNHNRSRLELARLYSEIGQYELARTELDTVLSGQLPSNVRDTVLTFKSNLDKRLSRSTFNGVLFFGGGYDSNANNDIGNKEFLIPSFNLWINGNEKISDTSVFAMTVLNYAYDFGDRGGWSVDNSVVGYTKSNFKESKNNLSLFSYSLIPTWSASNYQLRFPLTYDRVYIDNKGYTYNLSSTLNGTYTLDPISQVEGGYTYKRGYYDDDKGLDVSSHSIFTSYKKAFGEDPIVISLNGAYTINNEIFSNRSDVSSRGYSYGAEIFKAFSNQIRTSLAYMHSSTSYEDRDVLFENRRHDTRENYEVRLSKQLQSDLSVNAIMGYVQNHSNQAPYTYDKITAQISAVLSF